MNWYRTSKNHALPMPTRKLGKTKYNVGIISLGGQGSLENHGDDENCIKIIQRAYELGVNYFDTSPIYGPSEDLYGRALKGIRNKIFLATKTEKRNRDGALKDIEKSLKRLKTDYLDLWQIHHIDTMEEVNEVTQKGGALEALREMREQRVIKYIGLTGHSDTEVLLKMMARFDFDVVLCPVNAADKHMKSSFINTVVERAQKENMGIIGMKVFAQGYIFHPKGITTSWEPICYTLSQPVSTFIFGCDTIEQLEENVAIAKSFKQMDEKQIKEVEEKTKKYKRRGSFFRKEYGGYDSKYELSDPYTIPYAKEDRK